MKIIFKDKALSLEGTPCVLIRVSEKGEEMSLNSVLEKAIQSNLRNIWVFGNVSEEAELKTVVVGLAGKGKIVTFVTSTKENIGPIRMSRGLKIILKQTVEQALDMPIDTVSLMKLSDEFIFTLKGGNLLAGYNFIKDFLTSKRVSKPQVTLRIVGNFESEEAKKEYDTLLDLYLEDAGKYLCRTKLL